jgi:cytoskeletal protein RodZ
MVGFKKNTIISEKDLVAETVRETRLEKNISLKEAVKATGIRQKYLEAIEQAQWYKLPAGVYGKNFLREYAIFLGLRSGELVALYEKNQVLSSNIKKDLFSKQVVNFRYFLSIPKLAKSILIIFIAVICFSYLIFSVKSIVTPPSLSLSSPNDNMITEKKTVDFIGNSEPEAEIQINGNTILSDSSGFFSKKIDLKDGINTITIIAKKKYGSETVIKRQILVKG